jgi:hypothetical protein
MGVFSGSVVSNITDIYTSTPAVNYVVTIDSSSYGNLLATSATQPNTMYVISGSNLLANPFPYTGSALISGSLTITGSSYGNVVSGGIASNTASIDLRAGNYFTCSLANQAAASITHFNILNPQPGTTAVIRVTTKVNVSASFSSNVRQTSGSRYQPTNAVSDDIISIVALDSTNVFLTSVRNLLP